MGNRLGWLIAGGIAAVLLVVIVAWLWPDSPTPPTAATTAPGRLDRIDSPESIKGVVPQPSASGLAADDYNKGVVEYYNSKRYAKLEKLSIDRQVALGAEKFPYRPHKFINAGAKKRRMGYFEHYVTPAAAVRPHHRDLLASAQASKPPLPHLVAFCAMADAALVYGKIHEKRKESRQAERLYQAVLTFGHHVAEDRVRLWGLQTGLEIQRQAAQRLAALYDRLQQPEKRQKTATFLDDLTPMIEAVKAKESEAVFRVDGSGHLHAGDLQRVAANDADPMWRVEAIRRLGLCRAALGQGGNQADRQAIAELLDRLAGDDDRFIAAAAAVARGMTIEDVRAAY